MSVRVSVPEAASTSDCAFVYSPVLEAVLSLSILVQPSHHPLHHEWARATRKLLPPEIKQRVADFRFGHMHHIPAGLLPPRDADFADFDSELARIEALSTEEKSRAILQNLIGLSDEERRSLDTPGTRDAILERSADLGSATVNLVQLGLEHPAELADRFLAFLARYWEAGFSEEWERVGPLLAETTAQAESALAEDGLFSVLETLRPQIGVNRDAGEFWVRRRDEHEVIAAAPDTEILFAPSAFLWPHIGFIHDSPDRVAVVDPAPFAAYDSPPDVLDADFVALLRGLGDSTRLRALKLIAERPRSTQELAKLLAISEPAMSRHLRQLADSGLLDVHRDGYYVLYSLVRERVEPLSASLLAFLDSD
jgi:DNA-binding transcriptional ArsR family regulator